MIRPVLLLSGVVLASAPAAAAPAGDAVTCGVPIQPGMSARQVQAKFGKAAKWETLNGAEGIEYPALVLWGGDPARRLELPFDPEDHAQKVTSVVLGPKARWTVAGLKLGDPLARIEALNGKPFKLQGFDWDYGGYVSDWGKGKLARLPGGCSVSIRLEPSASNYPSAASGDRILSSTNPAVRKARPVIDELSLNLPEARGK